MPLEASILFRDNKLLVDLGVEQGLTKGRVGLVSSTKNMNYNTSSDWSVLTVTNSFNDYSELETLNSDISGNLLDGKIIRFLN